MFMCLSLLLITNLNQLLLINLIHSLIDVDWQAFVQMRKNMPACTFFIYQQLQNHKSYRIVIICAFSLGGSKFAVECKDMSQVTLL